MNILVCPCYNLLVMSEKKKYKDPRYTDKGYENFHNYQKEFVRTHYKKYLLRFHTEKEADIIEYLNGIDGLTQYLKNLIREDMEKHK